MAKTDNLDNDEVYDAIKNPLERPLEVANDYNKRSEIGTSKSIDKISKLEGDSSQGKIKSETDELVLSAIMVELSSNSATHSLAEDKVDTDPAEMRREEPLNKKNKKMNAMLNTDFKSTVSTTRGYKAS